MVEPMTTRMSPDVTKTVSDPEGLFRTKYGYFTPDGREYVITRPDTPRPWVNVISNGDYGMMISQTGGGYSWWKNANLARLTRWVQDMIQDDMGKFLYLRDDDEGKMFDLSAGDFLTLSPVRDFRGR